MRSWRRFYKYFTFEEASEQELRTWTDSFLGFLRKVGEYSYLQVFDCLLEI